MDEQREALLADELHAWASERGNVYRSARDMVVVHGGVTEHHHEHYHSRGESTSRTSSPSEGEECPYPGLRAFDTDEAEWFFGREALVSRVMNRLELCVSDHSPLAVVAPSGAGKSSLLRAGVLPGLAQGRLPGSRHWPQLLLTPTAEPLAALASGLGRLMDAEPARVTEEMEAGRLTSFVRERLDLWPDRRVVLVVDQLEELFTVCQDESVRRRFVDVLAELTGAAPAERTPGDETPVALAVYGLRADFYGSCSAFPHLRDALVERQVIVGPMSDDEVRRAVTMPAERARLTLAPGLVDVVLRDLRGSSPRDEGAYEAGRLPLLAHALRATWLERRGDTLTVDSYRDTDGIDGAVAATAEEEFGKLTPSARLAARLMFLGLVRIGEDGEVTRRRRTRADLLLAAADPKEVPDLAERFTRARLLTQGVGREGTVVVEVTHEALLWAWPRLHRDWIGAGRSGIAVRQEVEEAAVAWERGGRKDMSALLGGTRLELARSWAAGASPEDLTPLVTPLVKRFLAASERQERRSRRLKRGAVTAVSLLAVLAMVAATVAFQQSRNAVEQRDNAIFDRVSAEADRLRETDGALAAQLDLVAHRMRPTDRLHTRLMTAANAVLPSTVPGDFGTAPSVVFGPEGRLATGGGSLRFWDARNTARPVALVTEPGAKETATASTIAYNAKGDLLARGDVDGKVRLIDVSDPKRPVALNAPWSSTQRGMVMSLQFSPDSRTLAVAVTDNSGSETSGTVYLIDVSDPRRPRTVSRVVSVEWQLIMSVAFSHDGRTLAVTGGTGGPDGDRSLLARLWDVSDPARPKALGGELGEHRGIVNKAAFSPVAPVLATGDKYGRVRLWDVSDPRRPKLSNTLFLGTSANALAFSSGGHLLATGDDAGNINVWNVAAPEHARTIIPTLRGHNTLVSTLAFARTGLTLVSGGGDGKVHLWRVPSGLSVLGGGKAAEALALTGDGQLLAVASGPQVTLFDLSDPTYLKYVGGFTGSYGTVSSLAFLPRGSGTSGKNVLATGGQRGDVRLWDVSAPTRPLAIGNSLPGQSEPVSALAVGADGSTLVAASMDLDGGYDGGLRAWNVADPTRPTPLGGELDEDELATKALAVGSGSGHLYSAQAVGDVRAWRTAKGAAPVRDGGQFDAKAVISLDAHPRAPLVATGGADSRVRLFDVSRPASPKAVGKPPLAGGIVWSVGFAPDGTMLASGNSIGQVRLWNTADPAHSTAYGLPVTGHNAAVSALRYTPRGDVLVTAGQDGTVRLWQTDPARARAILCASTRSAMKPDVWKEYVSPALPYDPPCGK
ncbi:hypothetical protein ACFC0D_24585 [Streptomyces sp. NPDC056222]|uniref:nSTAND1 domain-containing NTPase n=1 Tax=Streptomyces sp. NPDC056222 TaxID=3345749 RepID=UPI0035D7BC7B